MYICLCNGITDSEIRACADKGKCTLRDLEHCLGVGVGCGKCKSAAKEILRELGPDSRPILSGAAV